MSLIAQMQRDRQQGEPTQRNNELPLFAAAEAIAASKRKRKRSSLLVLAPALLVPVLIIVAPVLVGKYFTKTSHVHASGTAAVFSSGDAASPIALSTASAAQKNRESKFIASAGGATSTTLPDTQAGVTVTGPVVEAQPGPGQQREIQSVKLVQTQRADTRVIDAQQAGAKNIAVSKPIEKSKPAVQQKTASARGQRIEVQAKLEAASFSLEKQQLHEANIHAAEVVDFKRVAPVSAQQRDRILFGKAGELVERGASEMARQMLQSEMGQSMSFPDSAALFGSLLVESREFERAADILASYSKAHPGHAALQVMQLRLHLSQGLFDNVLQSVSTLSPELRDRVDVIEMQAAALQSLGDYGSASYYYRQLLRRDDTNARWWMGLAVALDADANNEEARRAYTMALEHRGLGVALAQYARQRLTQI